jgi:uncharacterized protein (TIGR03435 family)
MRNRDSALALAALVLITCGIGAQEQSKVAVSDPAFDVASVKINRSGEVETTWRPETGRFTTTNVTLKQMISTAYGPPEQPLPDYQMSGGPSWIGTSRFDVVATAPGATPAQMQPMLRRLLEARFMLRTHVETHQRPIYSLTLANRDGSLGPGMRRSTTDCAALAADPSAAYRCGGGRIFPGTLSARGVSIARVVNGLARIMPGVSRPVIDNTGLTGVFDIDLMWRPESLPADPDGRIPPLDPNAPDLFTALREQWGVKLEAGTGPVMVLVIDSVSLPAED